MSTTQTAGTGGAQGEAAASRSGHREDAFLAEMNRQAAAGIPNLDNIGDGRMDYDGPRCGRCEDTPVDDENVPCADCLTEIGDDHWACPRCPAHWYRSYQSREEWAARLPAVQAAHLARHDRDTVQLHDQSTCPRCGDDGFTFHSSPTNGAVELDGPCPACTGRTF